MNERIQELAKQAGLEMCGCGCDMPTRQSAKFAELIVQECATIADKDSSEPCASYGKLIKQHFGVK